jgi:hypothetical protein
LSESTNLVRVGIRRETDGQFVSITLPQRGHWIRQGQKVCTIHPAGVRR